jgi:NADH-quinone oxidoreductase subunit M
MPDLRAREVLVLAPLLGLIVFLGIYPKPVLERMEPSVVALIDHVSRNVPEFSEKGPRTDEHLEEEKLERERRAAENAAEAEGGAGGEHK